MLKNSYFRTCALGHYWLGALIDVYRRRGNYSNLQNRLQDLADLASIVIKSTFLITNPLVQELFKSNFLEFAKIDFMSQMSHDIVELVIDAWNINFKEIDSKTEEIASLDSKSFLKLQLSLNKTQNAEDLQIELIQHVIRIQSFAIITFKASKDPYEKFSNHQIKDHFVNALINVMEAPIKKFLDLAKLQNETDDTYFIQARDKIADYWKGCVEYFWKIYNDIYSKTPKLKTQCSEVIKDFANRVLDGYLKIQNPKDLPIYGLKLLFFTNFFDVNNTSRIFYPEFEGSLKENFKGYHLLLDYVNKVNVVVSDQDSETIGRALWNITEKITYESTSVFKTFKSKSLLITESQEIDVKLENSLANTLESWKKSWEIAKISDVSWKKSHLLFCFESLLKPKIYELYTTSKELSFIAAENLINKGLSKLSIHEAKDAAISITRSNPSDNLVKFSTDNTQPLLLLAEIIWSEPGLFSKYKQTVVNDETESFIANAISNQFTKVRAEFIKLVQQILLVKDENPNPEASLDKLSDNIEKATQLFSSIVSFTGGKLLDFVVCHLDPQLNNSLEALTAEHIIEFLRALIQHTGEAINTKGALDNSFKNSVLVKALELLTPYIVSTVKEVSICYEKDSNHDPPIIANSKQFLRSLDDKILQLLTEGAKLCLSTELISNPHITSPLCQLLAHQLSTRAIELKQIGYDSVLLRLLIKGSSLNMAPKEASSLLCLLALALDNSFPIEAWIEAVIKNELYSIKEKGLSLAENIFLQPNSKAHCILSLHGDVSELSSILKNRFCIGQEEKQLNLEKIDLTSVFDPLNPETNIECLELMLRFANGLPAVDILNSIISIIVKDLVKLLLWNDEKTLKEQKSNEGLFFLEILSSILLTYPYLMPYVFLYDISGALEDTDESYKQTTLNIIQASSITKTINSDILSHYKREVKHPFGVYVIEVLTMIPHPCVVELIKVFTSLPLPLLVKSSSKLHKVIEFTSCIQECIEIRSAEKLKQIASSLKQEKFELSGNEGIVNLKEMVKELTLGAFVLANHEVLSSTQTPVKETFSHLMIIFLHMSDKASSTTEVFTELNDLIQTYLLQALNLPNTKVTIKELWNQISAAIKEGEILDNKEAYNIKVQISSKQGRSNRVLIPDKYQEDYKKKTSQDSFADCLGKHFNLIFN